MNSSFQCVVYFWSYGELYVEKKNVKIKYWSKNLINFLQKSSHRYYTSVGCLYWNLNLGGDFKFRTVYVKYGSNEECQFLTLVIDNSSVRWNESDGNVQDHVLTQVSRLSYLSFSWAAHFSYGHLTIVDYSVQATKYQIYLSTQ